MALPRLPGLPWHFLWLPRCLADGTGINGTISTAGTVAHALRGAAAALVAEAEALFEGNTTSADARRLAPGTAMVPWCWPSAGELLRPVGLPEAVENQRIGPFCPKNWSRTKDWPAIWLCRNHQTYHKVHYTKHNHI